MRTMFSGSLQGAWAGGSGWADPHWSGSCVSRSRIGSGSVAPCTFTEAGLASPWKGTSIVLRWAPKAVSSAAPPTAPAQSTAPSFYLCRAKMDLHSPHCISHQQLLFPQDSSLAIDIVYQPSGVCDHFTIFAISMGQLCSYLIFF